MRIFSKDQQEYNSLVVQMKGYDGPSGLYKFIESLKPSTFIVVDKDDTEFTKAFYINRLDVKCSIVSTKSIGQNEFTLTITGDGLITLAELIAYIENIGGVGHSFSYEDSNGNKSGWDGDGSDRVLDLTLYGINIKPYDFVHDRSKVLSKIQKAERKL